MRVREGRPGPVLLRLASTVDAVRTIGSRSRRAVRGWALAGRFAARGDNVVFDPDGVYSFATIELGSNVDLGYRPTLIAARARIRIGNNVMFGPEVTIRGGNHRTDQVGLPMIAVQKQPGDERYDLGVTIEDDVWIGTRAVVLHGVTVGRGAVVGAGAVVTRSVPPYAIVAGNPARVIRLRWPVQTIRAHEVELYPPDQRLSAEELAALVDLPGAADRSTVPSATKLLTTDAQDR
ncbi:acyltransferase [Micromonospora purpureochromogenes]|uniref:acyltransferase n=1 Tax=Micromonospora purpureochromogenes TaxID=47872 RepID=UPI00362581B2